MALQVGLRFVGKDVVGVRVEITVGGQALRLPELAELHNV